MPNILGEVTVIKNLSVLLKDIEPIIKNPRSLYNGREITNFNLRPREAVGLFLIGTVFNEISEEPYYITTDPLTGDGTLSRKGNSVYFGDFLTEQTMVTQYQEGDISDRIIASIKKKEGRGKNYAKNRNLVVFLDKVGEIDHRKIQEYLESASNFQSYWLIGLIETDGNANAYFVAVLKSRADALNIYKVHINPNFSTWTVELLRSINGRIA